MTVGRRHGAGGTLSVSVYLFFAKDNMLAYAQSGGVRRAWLIRRIFCSNTDVPARSTSSTTWSVAVLAHTCPSQSLCTQIRAWRSWLRLATLERHIYDFSRTVLPQMSVCIRRSRRATFTVRARSRRTPSHSSYPHDAVLGTMASFYPVMGACASLVL